MGSKEQNKIVSDANVIWLCPACERDNRWHWVQAEAPQNGDYIDMICDFCLTESKMYKKDGVFEWTGISYDGRKVIRPGDVKYLPPDLTTKTEIKDSGERSIFTSGAQRDLQSGKGRFDLIPDAALWELAKHYERGALKYSDRNWEKGMPMSRFIDSASRHLAEFKMGLVDEPHLVSALWNLICALETIIRIQNGILPKELDDLPYPFRKEQEAPQV